MLSHHHAEAMTGLIRSRGTVSLASPPNKAVIDNMQRKREELSVFESALIGEYGRFNSIGNDAYLPLYPFLCKSFHKFYQEYTRILDEKLRDLENCLPEDLPSKYLETWSAYKQCYALWKGFLNDLLESQKLASQVRCIEIECFSSQVNAGLKEIGEALKQLELVITSNNSKKRPVRIEVRDTERTLALAAILGVGGVAIYWLYLAMFPSKLQPEEEIKKSPHEGNQPVKPATNNSLTDFDLIAEKTSGYIDNFFSLASAIPGEKIGCDNLGEARHSFRESLLDLIDHNPVLREFTRKPARLKLMCGVWYERFKIRPCNELGNLTPITDLYREIIIAISRHLLKGKCLIEGRSQVPIDNLSDADILTDKAIQSVLGFLKRLAAEGSREGEKLLLDYPRQTAQDLETLFALGLVEKNCGAQECRYQFFHPSFQEFFQAWNTADQLTEGKDPSALLPKYALKNDRVKWLMYYQTSAASRELVPIASILWRERREFPLKNFLNFLLNKENAVSWSSSDRNIDKYILPLGILLFEEMVPDGKEEYGYEWLNTIKKEILVVGCAKINELLQEDSAELYQQTQHFIETVKKSPRMRREIIAQTKLVLISESGFKSANQIKIVSDLGYYDEKIIQHLIDALSNPSLVSDAKLALIDARVKEAIIKSALYKEKGPQVIKAKTSVMLELMYVNEAFFDELKRKVRADESSCKLVVTVMGVVGTRYKKEEVFDSLLGALGEYSICTDAIYDALLSLNYFDEPKNLHLFAEKIATLLEDKKADSPFVVSYLEVLNKLSDVDDLLEKIVNEEGPILKKIEKLLDKKSEEVNLGIIKLALLLVAKGAAAPKSFEILINYSNFGSGKHWLSHIREIAIKGLSKFRLTHAEKILGCLTERLSDAKETESNKLAAIQVVGTLYERGDDVEINLVLLRHFLSATLKEKELMVQRIKPLGINHEIGEALKEITADYNTQSNNSNNREASTHKEIILKFISSTSQQVIEYLLKDENSFIYDLPRVFNFFDEKIAIAFCNILSSEESSGLVEKSRGAFDSLQNMYFYSFFNEFCNMMDNPINGIALLQAFFVLDNRGQLSCNSSTLFVLIKLLEIDFGEQVNVPVDSKKRICSILDRWYRKESSFKENLASLEGKNLPLFAKIKTYYGSWSRVSLYDAIKFDLPLERPPLTSSAMHSRPLPVWTKPFSAVGNLIGQAFEQVKTVGSGFVGVVDDVRSYLLAEPALISPVATQPETGSGQTYDNENQAEDNSTSGRAFTRHGSFFRPVLSYGEVAQVAFPVLNKLSERYELFGYKPLSEEEVEQYEVQHSEELEEIEASLEEMEGHPILERRLEYRIAQEAFEQAKLCFRNSFEDPPAQDGKVTESEHEKVVQTIDRAQQAVMTLEALKVQSEKFSQELEKIMYVQDHIREELQKIRLDFEDQIKQLRREQRAMAPIESEWDRLEEDICQMQKAYEDKEPLYNAMDYLLGKIDQQLEIGSLNDQLPVMQNQLNLLAGAMQEITTNTFDVESGLAANVIAAADKWRSGELMKSHVAQADKTLRPENHRRSSVLTDFFAVPSTRDRLPVSITTAITDPTQLTFTVGTN